MANRIMDPHELGSHSVACMGRKGCVHGIKISYARPWLLNTKEKVSFANKIREKIGGELMNSGPWKLGDHCWYTKK